MFRKKTLWILIILIVTAIVVYFGFDLARRMLPQQLRSGEIEIARVELGEVYTSIAATGIVEPENEVLLLSPTTSVIKKINRVPGSRVSTGEIILFLDAQPVEEQIEKLEEQLEMKRNNLEKTRLNARSTRVDLDYNVEMKKLRIASIKSDLADQLQLLEVGGVSPAAIEKTRQELVFAEKDLETILEKNSIRLKQLQAEEEGLLLDIRIHERQLESQQEILQKMAVRAPSSGIVLSVFGKEGERVNAATMLVRMSDLSTYKVNGKIPEQSADLIKTGGQVFSLIDRERLPGKIGTINPLISDGMMQFDVHLSQGNHPKLLPNQKVELSVIISRKDSVLRIRTGAAFERGDRQQVFVVDMDRAVRRELVTGIKGHEFIEIVSGAEESEQIIVSDMSRYRHLDEIEIKDF